MARRGQSKSLIGASPNAIGASPADLVAILEALAKGETPKPGTQEPGRHTVEPMGGPTSLVAMVSENHDYRPEWGA